MAARQLGQGPIRSAARRPGRFHPVAELERSLPFEPPWYHARGVPGAVFVDLEDGRVRRLGGKSEIQLDVRVIAATNAPLDAAYFLNYTGPRTDPDDE